MLPSRSSSQRERRHPQQHRTPSQWPDEADTHIMLATFPIHPLPGMQAPFEESMLDATGENGHVAWVGPQRSVKTRQHALCRDEAATEPMWNFTYNCHWRRHPTDKFHPLRKTVAQVVFGIHLLHQHLERSVADVADILLKHVNELDSFLQQAGEDLESSLKDMVFRHKCLKVPMEHVNEFDRLLEDRNYRAQLLDGNIVIERTIGRMSTMLNDYLIDVNTFQEANRELDLYLLDIGNSWAHGNEDIRRIYSAMCGNTGGWAQFLQSLVVKAERLGVVLVQVSSYCNEIEKRCGAAGRRSMVATRTSSRNSSNSRENGRSFRNFPSNKPLPIPPNERPPFQKSTSNDSKSPLELPSETPSELPSEVPSELPAEIPSTQRQSLATKSKPRHPSSLANTSNSSTPKQSNESDLTSATSQSDGVVRNSRKSKEPEYYHEVWHDESHRESVAPTREQSRTSRLFGHRRKLSSEAKLGTDEKLSSLKRLSTKLDSPPLTGNDSAYSSIDGASFSPMLVSPRSASSLSSRQNATLGLFPSSNLNSPMRGTTPSRLGALSPTSGPLLRTVKSDVTPSNTRPSTSAGTSMSNRKLSKRNSLMSLKRLFTKRQVQEITPIRE